MQRILYLSSLVLVASIPATNLPVNALGSIHRVIGLLVGGIWILTAIFRGTIRRPSPFHFAVCAFFLWNAVSLGWSIQAGDTIERLIRLAEDASVVVLVWDVLRTWQGIDAALGAYVIGAYVSIIWTVINYRHGAAVNQWDARFAGGSFDPNDLGVLIALGIAPAWKLAMSREKVHPAMRFLCHVYPLAALLCIILTASRGALVASIPAFLYVLVNLRKLSPNWRVLFVVCAIAGVGAASQVDFSRQVQRLETITQSAGNDKFTGRLRIWQLGWGVVQRNSMFGVGAGAFPEAIANHGYEGSEGSRIVAHNTYLSVLTELGSIGLVLFMVVLASVVLSLRRIPRGERAMWVCLFLTWAVAVASLTWEYRAQTWLVMALITAAAQAARGPARVLRTQQATAHIAERAAALAPGT